MPPDKSDDTAKRPQGLRQRAEALLNTKPADFSVLRGEDIRRLIHELSVHQIELEIQNEELRQAQAELAASRDQYAELYEFAPCAYLTLTRQGRILEANLTAEKILSVERKGLLRSNFSKYVARESADKFHLHLSAVFSSPIKQACEIELRSAGDSLLLVRLESIANTSASELCCRTVIIDINELKTVEKSLRESEQRLQRFNESLEQRVSERTQEVKLLAEAIAHLGEGVLITRDKLDWPGPEILFVNEAMCRISGYQAEELIGRSPRILQGPGTERETLDQIKTELSAGRSCVAELTNYRKDGTAYSAELFITPLADANGRRSNFVSIHRDISERKRAEEALRQSHDQLEQRVNERTRALEEANRRCEGANAAKSRFLTAASHDLRQPLTAIELYLAVLSARLGRSEDQEICNHIHKSLEAVNELLNALLDISKFKSGTIKPSKQDFPLRPLLDRIVTDNRQQADRKGLQLVAVDTDCIVHSDPALLERVIENFVSNAIRYTEKGRISINCECSGETAKIIVGDTGIGIAEDALEAIFEEYFQLDNPMRDRRNGLGLGLSIVKDIAQLLDHRVLVHSISGEGSRFVIEVPLGKKAGAAIELSPPAAAKQRRERAPMILLVEDDMTISAAMTMLLESAHFQVECAANGDQALARIEAGLRPDILICDYRLPGYTGIEVIRRARDATFEGMPAILLTGDTSLGQNEADLPANCTVLLKPVHSDQLISLIEHLTAKGS